jgi:hypothetical protein
VTDGHVDMLRHFVSCIRTGELSASESTIGWNALAAIEAAVASMQSGRREIIRSR